MQLNHQQFDVYKATRAFIKECYLATKDFPQAERYALLQQIRRAAFSVHVNLSEGFSRKSEAERKRYFEVSRGSIIEIDAALDAAEDLGYCKKENLMQLGICMNRCFSMLFQINQQLKLPFLVCCLLKETMSTKKFSPEEIMQKVATGKAFTLLILFAGDPVPDDDMVVNQMQLGHLAHLFTMEEEGKCCVYGPISNHDELHGIIIFNTTNRDDIHKWMADDPYIKAGHLKYELYDWFTIPGQKIPE